MLHSGMTRYILSTKKKTNKNEKWFFLIFFPRFDKRYPETWFFIDRNTTIKHVEIFKKL